MQVSQSRTANPILAKRADQLSVFAKFLGGFANLRRKLSPRAEDRMAGRYGGIAWCDTTEHRLNNELMTGMRTRY